MEQDPMDDVVAEATAETNQMRIWNERQERMKAFDKENPQYQILVFDSARELQDELNRIAEIYELVSIADTRDYITAAVKRKDFTLEAWGRYVGPL